MKNHKAISSGSCEFTKKSDGNVLVHYLVVDFTYLILPVVKITHKNNIVVFLYQFVALIQNVAIVVHEVTQS